jgi:co-chaperonin GroES (HSP10)
MWKPTRDLCFIRELPVEQKGLIIPGVDLNRSAKNSPVLAGIVEAIGPKVTLVAVGDKVWYEIGSGEFRVPGDDMVRIILEEDVAMVEDCTCGDCAVPSTQCPGSEVVDGSCIVRRVYDIHNC